MDSRIFNQQQQQQQHSKEFLHQLYPTQSYYSSYPAIDQQNQYSNEYDKCRQTQLYNETDQYCNEMKQYDKSQIQHYDETATGTNLTFQQSLQTSEYGYTASKYATELKYALSQVQTLLDQYYKENLQNEEFYKRRIEEQNMEMKLKEKEFELKEQNLHKRVNELNLQNSCLLNQLTILHNYIEILKKEKDDVIRLKYSSSSSSSSTALVPYGDDEVLTTKKLMLTNKTSS